MHRLHVYFKELSKQDRIHCADMGMNLQYLEAKTGEPSLITASCAVLTLLLKFMQERKRASKDHR